MVLVTGATGGIGAAIVARLAAAGARVLATDVAEDAPAPPGGAYRRLDVRRPEDWRAAEAEARERWGAVDALLNVAGVARKGPLLELPEEDLLRQLEVNLTGAVLGMRLLGPAMVARGEGHIVNVTSLASVVAPPGLAVYAGSKFGLRGVTLALAHELAGTGVRVSLVGPDFVDTPMMHQQFDSIEEARAFGGPNLLTAERIAEEVVDRVMKARPLETFVPWSRGALGRVLCALPWVGTRILPWLMARHERAAQG